MQADLEGSALDTQVLDTQMHAHGAIHEQARPSGLAAARPGGIPRLLLEGELGDLLSAETERAAHLRPQCSVAHTSRWRGILSWPGALRQASLARTSSAGAAQLRVQSNGSPPPVASKNGQTAPLGSNAASGCGWEGRSQISAGETGRLRGWRGPSKVGRARLGSSSWKG